MTKLFKSYTAVHLVGQKVHRRLSKCLINEKFCDLSPHQISRTTGDGSADLGAGTNGEMVLKMWVLDPVIARMARMNAN